MSAPDRTDRPADLPTLEGLARARARARRVSDGREGRTAFLLPDGVQTTSGVGGPSADVPWADVEALARAFVRWAVERTTWAGYRERGLPPSQAAAHVHQPPGADAAPVTVGVATATAVLRGRRLVAPVVVRARAGEAAPEEGIVVVADLWRDEPGVGPVGGEKVGERWVLDGRVVVDVTRHAAVSLHGGGAGGGAPVPVAWAEADLDVPRAWLAARTRGR